MGSVEALEALQIATLNVFSFGFMVVGGLGWGFDIEGVQELRGRLARKRPVVVEGERDPGAEERELEGLPEWIIGMVGGKDRVVEKAKDMQRRKGGEGREKEKGIKPMDGNHKRDRIAERFAVVEERSTEKRERPWWKPW